MAEGVRASEAPTPVKPPPGLPLGVWVPSVIIVVAILLAIFGG